jgi:hypothetical protein
MNIFSRTAFAQPKLSRTTYIILSVFNSELKKYCNTKGACGRVVVKALCYKLEGRGFDTR